MAVDAAGTAFCSTSGPECGVVVGGHKNLIRNFNEGSYVFFSEIANAACLETLPAG